MCMRVRVCVCVNACTWRLQCTFFSSCRGTGADLPILSNEAMASQWKHSLIICVYLRSGRPNCTLKAVVSNSGQKSFKRFHMVDTFRLCRVWSCLSSFASVRAEPKCVCVCMRACTYACMHVSALICLRVSPLTYTAKLSGRVSTSIDKCTDS